MATSARPSEQTKSRTRPRQRQLSLEDQVLDLRNENPDIFETYDPPAIGRALVEALWPNAEHQNVLIEVVEGHAQTFRRRYDPNFDTQQRAPTTKAPPPKVGAAFAAFWSSVTPNTTMWDGRKLKDWTMGQVRSEHKGLSNFIARFAHKRDDELVGDDW